MTATSSSANVRAAVASSRSTDGLGEGMVGDLDVAIGGHDIDDARLKRLIAAHRPHRQHAPFGKNLAKVALAARIEMLGDNDRGWKVAGERRYKGEQRVDTASRRTDDDEAGEGFPVRLWNLSLVDIIRRVSHRRLSRPQTRQESRQELRYVEVCRPHLAQAGHSSPAPREACVPTSPDSGGDPWSLSGS